MIGAGLDADARYERFAKSHALLKRLSADYHADPALRARIDGGDSRPVLDALGVDNPSGVALRVVANTPAVHHVAMPLDPNDVVADSALREVAGGSTVGTGGTIGSAGCFACSTAASCLSSASTVGTAGSAG